MGFGMNSEISHFKNELVEQLSYGEACQLGKCGHIAVGYLTNSILKCEKSEFVSRERLPRRDLLESWLRAALRGAPDSRRAVTLALHPPWKRAAQQPSRSIRPGSASRSNAPLLRGEVSGRGGEGRYCAVRFRGAERPPVTARRAFRARWESPLLRGAFTGRPTRVAPLFPTPQQFLHAQTPPAV